MSAAYEPYQLVAHVQHSANDERRDENGDRDGHGPVQQAEVDRAIGEDGASGSRYADELDHGER